MDRGSGAGHRAVEPETARGRRPAVDVDRSRTSGVRSPAPDAEPTAAAPTNQRPGGLRADEAVWEASRLNTMLANKGYRESDVTRWWNFTAHEELGGLTISEAWRDGRYEEVRALIEQLPERQVPRR
jgi:hypothetical protein